MALIKQIIVIPARFASTRFPGKMLELIGSKSLIQHTFENAKRSKKIKDVLVATDHSEIKSQIEKLGGEVVMTPKSSPNGTTRVHQALEKLKKVSQNAIILNIQGDAPTVNPKCIDKLFELLSNNSKIKMATIVIPITEKEDFSNPSIVKCVLDNQQNALYFSRSPIPFMKQSTPCYKHIGVYAFRRSFLKTYVNLPQTPLQKAEDLEQLKVLENGYSIKVIIDKQPSVEVDEPGDIQKVKKVLCP